MFRILFKCGKKFPQNLRYFNSMHGDKKDFQFQTKIKHNTFEVPHQPPPDKVDESTISILEQLSLVACANKDGIRTLEDAIEFADRIRNINTQNVEPMYTVLEDRNLALRDDEVTEGYLQKDILRNATLIEEDYFVAPPGNIPLLPRENLLHQK